MSVTVDLILADGTEEDITDDVMLRDQGIRASDGVSGEGSGQVASPGRTVLYLRNGESRVAPGVVGRYTLSNARSDLYGRLGKARIRVTKDGSVRAVMRMVKWPPRWDETGRDVWMPAEAAGVLRWLGGGTSQPRPLESALRRYHTAEVRRRGLGFQQVPIVAYLPLEEPQGNRSTAGNLVPGAEPCRYGLGAPPEFARRPDFGRDDSCPGSAPLPAWPPIAYFGWSQGAKVAPRPPGPWAVSCIGRVPPGSGECWLMEWRTDGGRFTSWALKVNSSGQVQVVAVADAEASGTTITHTGTALPTVNDDVWHAFTVLVVKSSGVDQQFVWITVDDEEPQEFTTSSTTVGTLERIRPRPMFADPTDKEPIGLGHAAGYAGIDLPGWIGGLAFVSGVTSQYLWAARYNVYRQPVDGYADESAAGRLTRLGHERGVIAEVRTGETVLDTGGPGAEVIAPSAGLTTVTTPEGPTGLRDVNLLMLARASATGVGFSAYLRMPESLFSTPGYRATATVGSSSMSLTVVSDSIFAGVGISTPASIPTGTILANTDYWVEIETVGHTVRARIWPAGADRPPWLATVVSRVHPSGRAGWAAFAPAAGGTVTIDHFEVRDVSTVSLGAERIASWMQNVKHAVEADHGYLSEQRDYDGLTYVPPSALHNAAPVAELDYATKHLSPPFLPEDDDRYLTNDVTAVRIDGSSYNVQQLTGPVSVDEDDGIGPQPTAPSLLLATDAQLPDHAAWMLYEGTTLTERYPVLRVDLRRLTELYGATALVTALLQVGPGSRITIDNPPAWMPPEPIDLLILGRNMETISELQHVLELRAAPWLHSVGVWGPDSGGVDPDAPMRAAPGTEADPGTRVATSFAAGTDTSLVVDTTVGPPWSTDSDDVPLDIGVAGSRLRVTAITDNVPSVQNAQSARVASNPTLSLPVPTGDLTGRLLILVHNIRATAGGPQTGQGAPWQPLTALTQIETSGATGWIQLWWKIGAGEPSASYFLDQNAANSQSAAVVAVAGQHWPPTHAIAVTADASGTSISTPSTTPTDNRLAGTPSLDIRFGATSISATRTWTAPSGWTLHTSQTSQPQIAVASRQWSAAGATGTASFGLSGSADGHGGITVNIGPIRQTFTVTQAPVNGVEKTLAAGEPVGLWVPSRWAL